MERQRVRHVLVVTTAIVMSGCTTSPESAVGRDAREAAPAADLALVPMPSVSATTMETTESTALLAPTVAMVDIDGQLALVRDGVVADTWFKWDAFPSPDRSTAVLTLGPEIGAIGPERPVTWVSLPDGERLAEHTMSSDSELTATSLDGQFAGFTTRAGEPIDGAIAGPREVSLIDVIARDAGTVFTTELHGNFVPEAFSSQVTTDGVPALVFLLEYFPADAPRFYRVRVLSTETGEVSLPLNLRNKQENVDERMAGFSRSQVVAHDHGLLFTLYRGTIDGTPDGEPYAFVHTLDFADGVWCLEVDPRLGLDEFAGSLAVSGDRLYVASANGWIGSYPIPSLSDPNLSPSMDWVVEAGTRSKGAPVMTADDEAVYVVDPLRPGFLARVDPDGRLLEPTLMAGAPDAFAWREGALHAIGDDWATFGIGTRPGWLDEIAHLVVG